MSRIQSSPFGPGVAVCGVLICQHPLTELSNLNFYGNPAYLEEFREGSNLHVQVILNVQIK